MRTLKMTLMTLLGLILLAPIPQAWAVPVTFTFDCFGSPPTPNNCVNGGTLANHGVKPNSNKTQDITNITNYMNLVFEAAGVDNSVTFINRGTKSKKTRPDSSHPAAGLPYLGNSDGATDRAVLSPTSTHPNLDTYLINDWNNGSLVAADQKDRIVITFENPIPWVAFDWEIFPQTSFTNADITVKADGITIFSRDLTTFRCPSPPLVNGALTTCKNTEVQLGDLGNFPHFDFNTSNAAWLAAGGGNGGVHTLEFIDWTTAPIGIDNLQVGQQVPEPASLLLLGSGLAGLAVWGRRKNRKD